jgi:hypothetical protein
VSVTYSLIQATPYSALYQLTSPNGTASTSVLIPVLSDYATLYGAGATDTPLYKVLFNNGFPFATVNAAVNALYGQCDVSYTNAVTAAGFTGMSVYAQLSGAAAGNFRLFVSDIKDAAANGGLGFLRVSLRHSIVR